MADPIVQEIKEKIDIAEVIGEYVHLRRAGVNVKGLCPFHSEKTPSFMVSRERNSWHCFGCGEGGDVFSFLQKHEGLTFPEVLKILADKAGIPQPERTAFEKIEYDREAQMRDELLQINELAAKFYHEALLRSQSGQVAREYLQQRGLKDETIKKWQLGFAPDDWHQLETFLAKRGFNKEKAVQAGLLARGQGGQVYDRFRFRITFPLLDHYGRAVGFTSRTLSQDEHGPLETDRPEAVVAAPKAGRSLTGQAKYVNSPETAVYHKSKVLYGYYFAKKAIRAADSIVVVEGNMDVIASHQAGVENVVASSGTALTPDQLNLISRLTKNMIFAFDADKAGLAATRRALEIALQQGFNVRIAQMAGAKDPDELIKQDVNLWQRALAEAPNFLDFSFDLIFGTIKSNDKEGLRKAAKDYLQLIDLVEDSLTQAQESRRVAEKLDVPVDTILGYLKKQKNKLNTGIPASAELRPVQNRRSRQELLEERILALGLVDTEFKAVMREVLAPSDFSTLAHLAESVINNGADVSHPQLDHLRFLGEEELARLKLIFPQDKLPGAFADLCRELKILAIKSRMKELAQEILQKEKSGSGKELEALHQDFNNLSLNLTEITKE